MDLNAFLFKISILAIPVLLAITWQELAHGWAARYFGDRTAELLGRLSLNPLRHIDPVGTLLVPGLLMALGGPPIGWARPVPVATATLPNPRRTTILVALAGPAANLMMALFWCTVLGLIARVTGNPTLISWIALMAAGGISINVLLAIFNLLPIPPLAGGRILAALLPPGVGVQLERVEPVGFVVVVGVIALVSLGPLGGIFDPANRLVGQVIGALLGQAA